MVELFSGRGSPLPSLAAATVATSLAFAAPAAFAKDTGLIFVSNEKSNNLIVLEPKTLKVVKDM